MRMLNEGSEAECEESSRSTSSCIIFSRKWCHYGKVATVLNEEVHHRKVCRNSRDEEEKKKHQPQAAACLPACLRLRNLLLQTPNQHEECRNYLTTTTPLMVFGVTAYSEFTLCYSFLL